MRVTRRDQLVLNLTMGVTTYIIQEHRKSSGALRLPHVDQIAGTAVAFPSVFCFMRAESAVLGLPFECLFAIRTLIDVCDPESRPRTSRVGSLVYIGRPRILCCAKGVPFGVRYVLMARWR